MKVRFYADIYGELKLCPHSVKRGTYAICASSVPPSSQASGARRVTFEVDLPDELFIQEIAVASVAKADFVNDLSNSGREGTW
jgi:hypothetical protein